MTEPRGRLVPEFSDGSQPPRPWRDVVAVLASAEMFWLTTVRADGRPHVAPLPAIWDAGALHIATGAHEQKARNLAHDPRCVLTTGTPDFRSGLDVVVEGVAERVRDHDRLRHLAGLWKSKLDWDFGVGDGVFLDNESDGHGAIVLAIRPRKVLAFGKNPYTQTRFTF
jgi:general stress protein 26